MICTKCLCVEGMRVGAKIYMIAETNLCEAAINRKPGEQDNDPAKRGKGWFRIR